MGETTNLPHQTQRVDLAPTFDDLAPTFDDLALSDTKDIYPCIAHHLTCRRTTHPFSLMCATNGKAHHHLISFSNHIIRLHIEVRKGGTQRAHELHHSIRSINVSIRKVVNVSRSEEFMCNNHIPLIPKLLKEAPNKYFVFFRFAHVSSLLSSVPCCSKIEDAQISLNGCRSFFCVGARVYSIAPLHPRKKMNDTILK